MGGKAGSTFSTAISNSRNGIRFFAFIDETTDRFLPSLASETQGNFFDAPPPRISSREPMEEKRPLRRQPHFWLLIMLAVTAGGFLLVTWVAMKALFVFLQQSPMP
jgi:hypothetical protein